MTDYCTCCERTMGIGEYRYADPPRLVTDAPRSVPRFALAPSVRRDSVLCGFCVGRVYRERRADQPEQEGDE